MNALRVGGLILIATLDQHDAGGGYGLRRTFTCARDEGYPNARCDFEQSCVAANVNVRRDPSSRVLVINRLRRGDLVNVGRRRGGWCCIDVHGGNGWVSGRFIGCSRNPHHDLGPAGPGISPQNPEPAIVYRSVGTDIRKRGIWSERFLAGPFNPSGPPIRDRFGTFVTDPGTT